MPLSQDLSSLGGACCLLLSEACSLLQDVGPELQESLPWTVSLVGKEAVPSLQPLLPPSPPIAF